MITDFGISRVFLRRQSFTATPAGEIPGGTDRWMAPELLSEEYLRPTKESDIWSFGCICYEVKPLS
jgi:serine/threonine protein kinase